VADIQYGMQGDLASQLPRVGFVMKQMYIRYCNAMKKFIKKIVTLLSEIFNYLFHLELEKEERQYRFIAQIKIANNIYYFGPFYTEEQLYTWLHQNHVEHLNATVYDLHHPLSERSEWPI
jgi:hypothetical protein